MCDTLWVFFFKIIPQRKIQRVGCKTKEKENQDVRVKKLKEKKRNEMNEEGSVRSKQLNPMPRY